MKKLLNTLFVTSEDAYLTLDGENVGVNREKQVTARFPLHALAGIISFSYAGASPALMGACAKRDVSLSFCTPRGRFLARTCGVSNGNVLLRRTQYRTADDPPQACRIARMMVFGKIYNAQWSIERTCRDHAMRAGAWIEIAEMVDGDFTAGSLPSRERGLKWRGRAEQQGHKLSFPLWERGVKLQSDLPGVFDGSRSLRGGVD